MISPKLVEVGRHKNINLITNSEVRSIEGDPGNFSVTLVNNPRYIDSDVCTGCGDCARRCPASAINDINKGMNDRKATYIEYAQAVPLAFAIDTDACVGCGLCENTCMAKAVRYDDKERETEVTVGSLILSPGTKGFDPSGLDYLGYGKYPNVVTAEGFERILSAGGPYFGHVMRPLDREEPKSIAWLQCVGSRDVNKCGNGYCSSVCCMYATKEAMIAKEHIHGDLDCVVFNMDMRTFGKDYEQYYNRAKDKDGVQFLKGRIHTITEVPDDSGDLVVKYADETGTMHDEVFSMVVLSVGLQVQPDAAELAGRLGIELNEYNFAKTHPFAPVETSRPGVYTCGVFQGPKDIPSSVTEASAAACLAGAKLAEARGTDIERVELPAQMDVENEDPRIGVFVCNCGINIGGVVDVPGVKEYASTLPNVAYTDQNLFTCSQDTQDKIKERIIEHKLNRVVVASCSPKTHEGMFMETLEACGLNKYLFEMANIRNQNSWIHSKNPDIATAKAKDLVRMSVARAGNLKTLEEKVVSINKTALILGGGIAGMNAALGLSRQGFPVVLVESDSEPGGFARMLHHTIEGEDVQAYLEKLIVEVKSDKNLRLMTDTKVVGFEGFKGNFVTEILPGAGEKERIEHGVIIVATGATEYQPKEFMFGEDDRVMTQIGLADRLEEKGADGLDSVVMIQCVGSRNDENENCSRICCQNAVKNALAIKKSNPDTQVYVLYRDIRTYGLLEEYYTEARQMGVIFIRFDKDVPPEVMKDSDGVKVTVKDHILQRDVEIRADLLALSAGMTATDTEELSGIMKFNRNPGGYFIEAHVKLRPVDMPSDGVFLCGSAHAPKLISETISQAQAAASRATTFLAKDAIKLSAITAKVDTDYCVKCLTCVRSCPFGVPVFNTDEKVIEINEAICHGCGVCTAVCPRQTIQLSYYEDEQITCKIDALLAEVG